MADEEGFESIRDNLAKTSGIGNIPHIRVINLNKRDYTLTLEHVYDGRELELSYAKETLRYIGRLWGYRVRLNTKDRGGEAFTLICENGKVAISDGNRIR